MLDTVCLEPIFHIRAPPRASPLSARSHKYNRRLLVLLKRGIMGSYHKVSKDYLLLYVSAFFVALQEPEKPERICRSDYDVQ